ncbi:MAG: hypothetical protein COY02_00800, partial [Parcubacteria group bacterium CG_4_10_14_0_2_um_filter_41_6]
MPERESQLSQEEEKEIRELLGNTEEPSEEEEKQLNDALDLKLEDEEESEAEPDDENPENTETSEPGEKDVETEADTSEAKIDAEAAQNPEAEQAGKTAKERIGFFRAQIEKTKEWKEKLGAGITTLKENPQILKEIGKTAGKTFYNSASSVFGVKTASDLVFALQKKGDIYNYFKQRGQKKQDREELGLVLENLTNAMNARKAEIELLQNRGAERGSEEYKKGRELVKNAVQEFKQKIESASVPEDEKKEMRKNLAFIMSEHREKGVAVDAKRNNETQDVLSAYVHTKIRGTKIVKDAVNLGLTFSGMSAARSGVYMGFSLAESAQDMGRRYKQKRITGKLESRRAGKESSHMEALGQTLDLRDEMAKSALFWRGKETTGQKIGAGIQSGIKAFGLAARGFGFAGSAMREISDEGVTGSVENAYNEFLNALKETDSFGEKVGAGAGMAGKNFIENGSRVWNTYAHPVDTLKRAKDAWQRGFAAPEQEQPIPDYVQKKIDSGSISAEQAKEAIIILNNLEDPSRFGFPQRDSRTSLTQEQYNTLKDKLLALRSTNKWGIADIIENQYQDQYPEV